MITVSDRESFLRELNKLLPVNNVCCELGVFHGDFSNAILETLNPKKLVLVDPFQINQKKYEDGLTTAYSHEFDYVELLKRFQEQIFSKQVVVNKKYSYDAVKDYIDSSFDLIYIDASHLYEDVKKDLNDWLSKLKKNGIIAGHDYTDIYGFGVVRAVDEFIIENDFEMIILNTNGFDWALKKK